jgi:hypothetical protein
MRRPRRTTGRETSRSPARPRPPGAALAAAVAAAGLLTGCGGDAAASVEEAVTLRVVVPDANIREPGVPCSGARGFRYAHPQAPYWVQDAAGERVAAGVLPEGRAEKAFTIDLGERRQPTVCVMMVEVTGVATLDGLSLVIDDRAPLPITPNQNLAGVPEVVLR